MNIWWCTVLGLIFVTDDPGGASTGVDAAGLPPRFLQQDGGDDFFDDCHPWQMSGPNGCKNCSVKYEECNDFLECCEGFICGSNGFCSCSNDSKECPDDDDDDGGNSNTKDETLLEAAKIALAVALVIAALAAIAFIWKTFRRIRRGRDRGRSRQRGTRQRSSLTSVQRYVLAKLCNRPPRYEDDNYVQEEKPPPYHMAVSTVQSQLSTAYFLGNTPPFGDICADDGACGGEPFRHAASTPPCSCTCAGEHAYAPGTMTAQCWTCTCARVAAGPSLQTKSGTHQRHSRERDEQTVEDNHGHQEPKHCTVALHI